MKSSDDLGFTFGHVEADECGSLNEFLAIAPESTVLCGAVAADVSIRTSRAFACGERTVAPCQTPSIRRSST